MKSKFSILLLIAIVANANVLQRALSQLSTKRSKLERRLGVVYDIPVPVEYYYNPWDNSYGIVYPSMLEVEIPDEE